VIVSLTEQRILINFHVHIKTPTQTEHFYMILGQSMPTTARFMAIVSCRKFSVCYLTFSEAVLLITYPAGCDPIVYSLTLRKQKWCGVRRLVGSHNFLAVPSRSLVLPLNQSVLSVTWVSTSTATLAPPPMYAEPCHSVRCTATTSTSTSIRHQRLFSFSRCLARPLQARLRQLHVCRAFCLPPTTPT